MKDKFNLWKTLFFLLGYILATLPYFYLIDKEEGIRLLIPTLGLLGFATVVTILDNQEEKR